MNEIVNYHSVSKLKENLKKRKNRTEMVWIKFWIFSLEVTWMPIRIVFKKKKIKKIKELKIWEQKKIFYKINWNDMKNGKIAGGIISTNQKKKSDLTLWKIFNSPNI